LEAAFVLLEFSSPSRRIFIGSHSLPPLWFAVSVLQPSSHGGLKLLSDDHIDPTTVARTLETMCRTELWIKVRDGTIE
jgi:hypothetical protein